MVKRASNNTLKLGPKGLNFQKVANRSKANKHLFVRDLAASMWNDLRNGHMAPLSRRPSHTRG